MKQQNSITAASAEYDISIQSGKNSRGGRKVKPKLTYTFHNPNTVEDMVKHLSEVFAEVAVTRVQKAQEEQFKSKVEGMLGETVIA